MRATLGTRLLAGAIALAITGCAAYERAPRTVQGAGGGAAAGAATGAATGAIVGAGARPGSRSGCRRAGRARMSAPGRDRWHPGTCARPDERDTFPLLA